MRQYKGMVLNINKHDADSLAVVDSAGNKLRYGELVEFSEELKRELPNRSLVFVFADNDAEYGIHKYRDCPFVVES